MKKSLYIVILALLTFALAACGTSTDTKSKSKTTTATEETKEHTITHKLGTIKVKYNPQKVVVFDFGALDTLDQFGVEVAGVAKGSTLPSYLSKYEDDQYANVGGLKEPDFEKIYSLKPDLIIISGRQSSAFEELNKIAPTLFINIDDTKYMESFKENVNLLAQIFGKEDVAKTELAKIDQTVNSLKEMTASDEKKALITLTTGGKISAYGTGSRFGIIHDLFGLKPADKNIEVSTHGMSVSFEYIAEKNPDYLFVIDRDAVVNGKGSASEMFDNALINKTNAAKNSKIINLDPAVWYLSGGGLQSVNEMVKEIKGGIQ